jgi:hypothetical protein
VENAAEIDAAVEAEIGAVVANGVAAVAAAGHNHKPWQWL